MGVVGGSFCVRRALIWQGEGFLATLNRPHASSPLVITDINLTSQYSRLTQTPIPKVAVSRICMPQCERKRYLKLYNCGPKLSHAAFKGLFHIYPLNGFRMEHGALTFA